MSFVKSNMIPIAVGVAVGFFVLPKALGLIANR